MNGNQPFLGGRSPRLLLLWALLIGFGGWGKAIWEERLAQDLVRTSGAAPSYSDLRRDQLTQGAVVGLLAGFRALVADFYWLEVHRFWERTEWSRLKSGIELVVTLQPRAATYWDLGSWHLAYNAAANKLTNPEEPNPARRRRESAAWVQAGIDFLQRGVSINPEQYILWERLGTIYRDKQQKPAEAAECFRRAAALPGAPIYLERFYGYSLEASGQKEEAYRYWITLWRRPLTHTQPQYAADKIRSKIIRLEEELSIPPEKRIFPKSN